MFPFAQYKCILRAHSHCATAKAKANAKLLYNDCLQPDWKLHWIYAICQCVAFLQSQWFSVNTPLRGFVFGCNEQPPGSEQTEHVRAAASPFSGTTGIRCAHICLIKTKLVSWSGGAAWPQDLKKHAAIWKLCNIHSSQCYVCYMPFDCVSIWLHRPILWIVPFQKGAKDLLQIFPL